jgi:alkylation response protein AidB-like acyl-CoA dehydrogenase
VSGTLDWVTSWDIADVMLLMVQGDGADASSLISAFVPAGHGRERVPGLEPGLPLALMAMAGTHTRPLALTDVFLPDESIARIADREAWLSADAAQSANANPSAFGVARGAIAELDLIARLRSDSAIAGLTEALVDECRAVRRRAYALADDPKTSVDERLSVRAAALDHVLRATTAVVIARAGAAMRAGHDAERRVREALFLQVQAQTAASRSVSLDTLTARSRRGVADLG